MTRAFTIQNHEPEGTLRPLVITSWQRDGRKSEILIDAQRSASMSIHAAMPLIAIGYEHLADDAGPGAVIVEEAGRSAELQAQLDLALATNQGLVADVDRLSAEVTRLQSQAASHNPDAANGELARLKEEMAVLGTAYDNRMEDLKKAEAERDELRQQAAEKNIIPGELGQSEGTQGGSFHSKGPEPLGGAGDAGTNAEEGKDTSKAALDGETNRGREDDTNMGGGEPSKPIDDMTKAELLDEAKRRKVDVKESQTKAEIVEALNKG